MPEQTFSTPPSTSNQCFTIFEGGGAKGITHLGALKALQDVSLARIGAAGTSAGAIIAALTAVGYTADELFDPDGRTNILSRRGETPVSLLGARDWAAFARFRGKASDNLFATFTRRLRAGSIAVALAIIPPVLPIWIFCFHA